MDKPQRLVMAGVFAVWALFMGLGAWRGQDPAPWLWAVPSTTYTVLTGKIPGIRSDRQGTTTGEPATNERA